MVVCTVQIIRLINFFLSLPIFPQHTLFTPTIYTNRLVRHANTCLHSILLGLKLVQAGSYDEIDPVRQHTTTLVISTLGPPPPKKTGPPAPPPTPFVSPQAYCDPTPLLYFRFLSFFPFHSCACLQTKIHDYYNSFADAVNDDEVFNESLATQFNDWFELVCARMLVAVNGCDAKVQSDLDALLERVDGADRGALREALDQDMEASHQ